MHAKRLWGLGVALALLWLLGILGWQALARKTASQPAAPQGVWVYARTPQGIHGPVWMPAGTTVHDAVQTLGLAQAGTLLLNGQKADPSTPLPAAGPVVLDIPETTQPQALLPLGRYPVFEEGKNAPARTVLSGLWKQGDHTVALPAAADFVGEALAQYRLAPQGLDRLNVDETAAWPSERPVASVHVEERILLEQETLPFEITYKALPEEPIDTLKVVHPGAYGLQVKEVLVRYENGTEVDRIPLGSWVLREPQPKVIGYGTKIVIQTLDTPDGPIHYWRAVRVYATSYSPCRVHPDGRCDDITASGKRLKKGIIAVRLAWYRYMKGLRVYVPGYGFGEIADVGGGIPGKPWIDLGYSEEDYRPWHTWVTMYFLAPPPPPEHILWILP